MSAIIDAAIKNALIAGVQDLNPATVTNETIGTGDGTEDTFSDTLANVPVVPGSVTVADATGPAESFTDNGDGTLTGSNDGTGTINYLTGAISVTYAAAVPANLELVRATYKHGTWRTAKVGKNKSGFGGAEFQLILTENATGKVHQVDVKLQATDFVLDASQTVD